MNNEAFRNGWAAQFGTPSPKIICVGLNYSDHTAESGFEVPEGAAPVREVREHALRRGRPDRLAP